MDHLPVQKALWGLNHNNCKAKFEQYLVQSKPVYSNHFFAAKNGKKEPIVRKNDEN